MSYLDRLRELKAEKGPGEELTKPTKPGFGSFVSNPTRPFSGNSALTPAVSSQVTKQPRPAAVLREWHQELSALDPFAPRGGFDGNRWRAACEDACWLYENFASRAVRDGWSAPDLFGVLPSRPGWGGLCDRLQGARNLKMDQDRAAWSRFGVREAFCRGGGDDLASSGLKLIWEIAP